MSLGDVQSQFSGIILKSLQRAELSFCDNAASFLQTGFWGRFKARFGWEAFAFRAEWENKVQPLLVMRRSLAAGFSLAYIPWGPELPAPGTTAVLGAADLPAIDEFRGAALTELAMALKTLLPRDTVFIRFDPPWYSEGPDTAPPRIPPPFCRSGADIQAPDTVLLDLKAPMESIMEQMKPKWRYNARLALKKGVTVRRATAEEVDAFYSLLEETGWRDGIAIHSIEYYKTLLEESKTETNSPLQINLYLAEHEGDVLAGIVTLFRGKEAVYLYGASSEKKRSLMAPYALQIKAIEDAKETGCEVYDLFGIPPDDDPSHPMAGLYRFKTGFGGRIIHRPGSWDYPCRPLLYRVFQNAEALRKNLRTLKKRILKQHK